MGALTVTIGTCILAALPLSNTFKAEDDVLALVTLDRSPVDGGHIHANSASAQS